MGKKERNNIITLQIFQCGARAGQAQVTLSSHSRLSRATHLGIGEKKCNMRRRGAKPEHTWKLLLSPIHTRLCQAHRLHQGTYQGGAGAQRGIMKVIPVCQRDSLQEDGWEGQ